MDEDLKKACLQWEALRVAYNLFLFVIAAFVLGAPVIWMLEYPFKNPAFAIAFAVTQNVFFCLGPLTEIYVTVFLGLHVGRARYLLLVLVVLFSLGLTQLLYFSGG